MLAECQRDPVFFCREVLGLRVVTLDQETVLRSVRDNARTTARAPHGVGKTGVAAIVVLWFGFCFQPCKIITTATVGRQVKAQVWSEIPRFYHGARYHLGGEMQTVEWKISDNSMAIGFSTDNVNAFQGWHAEHILFVLDEAQGLADEIYTGVESSMVGAGARCLALGNPLCPVGQFFESFKSPVWTPIKMAAERHPNIVEGREVIPGGITREWMADRKREWGESDPRYVARVLGEFPQENENALVLLAWVDAALARPVPAVDEASLILAVDVARYGTDRTVLLIRDRRAIREVVVRRQQSTMETAGQTKALAQQWNIPAARVRIDDTGLGGGVTDRLREIDFGVQPVNFGEKASDPDRFANLRAECYWRLREALDPERPDGLLSADKRFGDVLREAAVPLFSYSSRGQIKIEAKEDVKARSSGQSPDLADALAMTFAQAEELECFIV